MADTINLQGSSLASRAIRAFVGERVIDIYSAVREQEYGEDEAGGLTGAFRFIWGLVSRLSGFILKNLLIPVVSWSFVQLFSGFLEALIEVFNFDFNQTDEEILSQIRAANLLLIESLGELVGAGLAWIITFTLATGATMRIPVLSAQIALKVAEEGGEELRGQLNSFVTVARQVMVRNGVLLTFLTARRMSIFRFLQRPGQQRREPWTIAGAIDNFVEGLPAELEAAAQGLIDGLSENLIEAGYVVAMTIDDYYATQRRAVEKTLGEKRGVIIAPDRRVPDENFVIKGSQEIIKPVIQNAIATHRLIYNRDVGQIVGEPAGDWRKAGYQRRILTLVFKSKNTPPYIASPGDPDEIKTVTITIPNADVGLSWERIKGASRRWTWGRFKATANLENGRKLRVNGASADEAEDKLREFLALQSADILTLSISEEKDRHPYLRKTSTVMYPAYGDLVIRRVVGGDSGNTDQTGQSYQQEIRRFDLWPENEPPEFEILP